MPYIPTDAIRRRGVEQFLESMKKEKRAANGDFTLHTLPFPERRATDKKTPVEAA